MTWRPVVTAVCAVLLAAGTTSCTPAAESAPSTAQSVVSAGPFTGSASASPLEGVIGDDEQPPAIASSPGHLGAPDGDVAAAVAAATQVVAGWLTADRTSRRDQLSGVAAEALIDAFDDPRYAPLAAGPVGPVHVVVAEGMLIVTRHRLDTGQAVDVTLIPESTALHGWIGVAIAEV